MRSELKLDYYMDGISEEKFVCTEIPLAVACGNFCYENYFSYILQLCIASNWNTGSKIQDNIFRNMNVDCEYIDVDVKKVDTIMEMIKYYIDRECPLIIPLKNESIYFSEGYKKQETTHFFLINGYDDERGVIFIRLSPHMFSSSVLNNNIGLYPYRMRVDMLLELWRDSNDKYNEDSIYKNKILVIKKGKEKRGLTFFEILEKEIFYSDKIENLFLREISAYNYNITDMKAFRADIREFRRYYDNYVQAFFYIVDIFLKKINLSNVILEELEDIKEKYLKKRDIFIAKFQLSVSTRKKIDFEEIKRETVQMDNRLFACLRKCAKIWRKELENDGIDYAKESKIVASSKDEVYFEPDNVCKDNEEIWRSKDIEPPHWLTFDLTKERNINKIEIQHDSNLNKMTKEYFIEYSLDGIEWHMWDQTVDNKDFRRIHFLRNTKCRYIRIFITKPSKWFQQARIKKISIWGTKT